MQCSFVSTSAGGPYQTKLKDLISTHCVNTCVTEHGLGWQGCSCVGRLLLVLICHMYLKDELISQLKLKELAMWTKERTRGKKSKQKILQPVPALLKVL